MDLSNGTGIVVGYVAAICIFFGLERVVYEFYKELKSEPQEVDAHTTSDVWCRIGNFVKFLILIL